MADNNVCSVEYAGSGGYIESGCVLVDCTAYDDVSATVEVYFRTPTERDAGQPGEMFYSNIIAFDDEDDLVWHIENLGEWADQVVCDLEIPDELKERHDLDVQLRDIREWAEASGIADLEFNYITPRYDEECGERTNEEPLFSKLVAYGKETGFGLKWPEW